MPRWLCCTGSLLTTAASAKPLLKQEQGLGLGESGAQESLTVRGADQGAQQAPGSGCAGRGSAEQGDLFGTGGPGSVTGQATELAQVDPVAGGHHADEQVGGDLDVGHRAVAVGR